jgi:hypothetical protein
MRTHMKCMIGFEMIYNAVMKMRFDKTNPSFLMCLSRFIYYELVAWVGHFIVANGV